MILLYICLFLTRNILHPKMQFGVYTNDQPIKDYLTQSLSSADESENF